MGTHQSLESAVRRFAAWDRPWTFRNVVRDMLNKHDQQQFEAIWQEAVKSDHWLTTKTLQEGAANAKIALANKFPSLAEDIIVLVTNAIAYEWK